MSRKHNRFLNQFAILTGCFFAVMGIISIRMAMASMGEELQAVDPYPLPAVSYVDENGKSVEVSSHKGKVVLLHFWASWCTPCVQEMPRMMELTKSLEDSSFFVLPVSLDRDSAAVVRFNDAHGLKLPLWLDPSSRAFSALKLKGVPSTLVLNEKGEVVFLREGPVNWKSNALRSDLWNLISASKTSEEGAAVTPTPSAPSAMSAPESQRSE